MALLSAIDVLELELLAPSGCCWIFWSCPGASHFIGTGSAGVRAVASNLLWLEHLVVWCFGESVVVGAFGCVVLDFAGVGCIGIAAVGFCVGAVGLELLVLC